LTVGALFFGLTFYGKVYRIYYRRGWHYEIKFHGGDQVITLQIQECFGKLTPAERKIAAWILANPQQVTTMTVSQLAGQCGSAPSAVIRFCKSVQVGGFSNLKLALAAELGSTRAPVRN
jgi:DNA-binding MurR/RpiR family transcriptional regulator